MPFQQNHSLRYYQFDIFSSHVIHGVFTRQGGVSPAPWQSLNQSISVGDDPARVTENRLRLFRALDRHPASLHDTWLVHGTDILHADAPRPLDRPPFKADIILTNNPRVSLFMRFADCVPLLFYDPKRRVIGIAHAGWMGTVKGAAEAAVRGMRERYGCKPENIIVGIGPSIGVDHYEVGKEVVARYREKFGDDSERIVHIKDGKTHLDLWTANAIQLQKAGVEQIQISGICTACHPGDWFSHRAEKGNTGRFGALMALA